MTLPSLSQFTEAIHQAYPDAWCTKDRDWPFNFYCKEPEEFLTAMKRRGNNVTHFWVRECPNCGIHVIVYYDYDSSPTPVSSDNNEESKETYSAEELRRIADKGRERKVDEVSEVLKPLLTAEFLKTAEEGGLICRMTFESATVLTSDNVIFSRAVKKAIDTYFPGVFLCEPMKAATYGTGNKEFKCSFSWKKE